MSTSMQRSRTKAHAQKRLLQTGLHRVMQTDQFQFSDVEACMSERERILKARGAGARATPREHPVSVVTSATTPDHFDSLVRLQGGWRPPLLVRERTLQERTHKALPRAVARSADAHCAAWSSACSPPPEHYSQVRQDVASYMYQHRRGIFVSLRGGRLALFQPLNATRFMSRIPPQAAAGALRLRQKWWTRDPRSWFVDHCFVDPKPHSAGTEWNTTEYLGFLLWVTRAGTRAKLPDVDFIINCNDFPALLAGSGPAVQRLPVLSAAVHPDYLDIPFVTPDDIEYATQSVFLHLPSKNTCRSTYKRPFEQPGWERRVQTAVFRGSATGCGVDADTNARLALARLALGQPPSSPPWMDVGITDFKEGTPRYDAARQRVSIVAARASGIPLSKPIPLHQQSRFRYILNAEGYSAAFRYLFLLSSGSVVINVESRYRAWYEPAINHGEHVVKVADVEGVLPALAWCRANDAACQSIARNAARLHARLATLECMAAYTRRVLAKLAPHELWR
jgi:hypothetical protein